MSASTIRDELETIRVAAQLLAQRHPMTADVLRDASEKFSSVIDEGSDEEFSDGIRRDISNFAADISKGGGATETVNRLESFEVVTLFDRIVALHRELPSSCSQRAD